MIWVCRPGKHGIDYDLVMENEEIFLGWEGYRLDLGKYHSIPEFKEIVIRERSPESRTTISNWAGQLFSFCCEMQKGDYVLVPNWKSQKYIMAIVDGDYRYDDSKKYPHVRKIKVISQGIPRSFFSQSTQYSLGAFRTLFKIKQEGDVQRALQSFCSADIIENPD